MTDNTPGTDVATTHMGGTELAIRPDQSGFDDTQVAALRALGVENAPEGEIKLLFHQSVRLGLDPFAKQIYLIGRDERKNIRGEWQTVGTKWTIQTGIDGFRVVRDRTKLYDGQELAWCGPDGIWHDVWTKPQPPVAARVLIYVKGRSRPEPGIAYYTEYAQMDKQGNPQAMWKKMPAGQLAKCAEALALRKAFPQDLSGVYVDEEMQQADVGADGVPSVTSVRARVEQDHDGPNVVKAMRGPGGSRTASKPAAGPAEPTRDKIAVWLDWESRINDASTLDSLIALHAEAADRHVLDHMNPLGDTIESVFLTRRAALLEAQQSTVVEAELDYPDETPF